MTGIVIVTWNSEEVIGACLDACLRFFPVEIVVIDNASTDRTTDVARERRGVRVIANANNRGFAAACNQGFAALPGCDSILLLNPDTELQTDPAEMATAMKHHRAGAVTGRLVGADGHDQSGFNVRRLPTPLALAFEVLGINRLFAWNPVNRRWRMADHKADTASPVEQPAGALLMVSRPAFEAVGGLDEGFWPAWFEDVDFCLRLRQSGYSIWYIPQALARHQGGHSASRLDWQDRQVFWYGSLLRYATVHFSPAGRSLVAAAAMLACVPRTVAGILSGHRLRAVGVYSRVFRAASAAWWGSTARMSVAGASSREENRARHF
jgi:GT2 family glycosyltransferase